jgi:VWFA-related protein
MGARFQTRVVACLLAAGLGASPGLAQEPAPEERPLEADLVEEVAVRLILLDAVVVDGEGRTVEGLTKDDFQIVVGGKASEIDTLDVDCKPGAADDPRGVKHPGNREVPPPPDGGRRIVLAFDYMHLGVLNRTDTLEHAMRLVRDGGTAGDEVMVVALTGGLRIEQPFTADAEATARTLKRMQYDISLWNGNFGHMSERGWVRGIEALLDVLGTMPGRKAIVLYSTMQDVPLDSQFARIAAAAGTTRCSFYPVDANGLVPPVGVVPGAG